MCQNNEHCPVCNSTSLDWEHLLDDAIAAGLQIGKMASIVGLPFVIGKCILGVIRASSENYENSDVIAKCKNCKQFLLECTCGNLIPMGKIPPVVNTGDVYICGECGSKVIFVEDPPNYH